MNNLLKIARNFEQNFLTQASKEINHHSVKPVIKEALEDCFDQHGPTMMGFLFGSDFKVFPSGNQIEVSFTLNLDSAYIDEINKNKIARENLIKSTVTKFLTQEFGNYKFFINFSNKLL